MKGKKEKKKVRLKFQVNEVRMMKMKAFFAQSHLIFMFIKEKIGLKTFLFKHSIALFISKTCIKEYYYLTSIYIYIYRYR